MEERAVSVDDALTADEVFATSTAGGIMPITRVNGLPVADGKMGRITKQLIEAYWEKHVDPNWSVGVTEILSSDR